MYGLLMVGLGGAIGALMRYGAMNAVQRMTGAPMPWGTLLVNAAVGLLGAFTTFSTFSWEVVSMLRDGEWLRAGVYAAGSVALGIVALAAGVQIAGGLGSRG